MTFCKLEKDQKTYEYLKKYLIWHVENKGKDFLELDSKIQLDEIRQHLELNKADNKNQEILEWIKKYSERFRLYLNSIKVIFAVWHCVGYEGPPDWNKFCSIVEKLDEIRETCLDGIQVERK